MAIGIRGRIVYTVLVSVTFVLSLVVTIMFELAASEQTAISAQSRILLVPLVMIRVSNYLFTLTTLSMAITTFRPGPNSPIWTFGLANATWIFAIFSLFFVFDFMAGANRYEAETLKKFRLDTQESRETSYEQLAFLKTFQKNKECCGLNGYKDYKKDDKYNAPKALGDGDDPDDADSQNGGTELTWGDFLAGTTKSYDYTDSCQIPVTKNIVIKGPTLEPADDVPLSCCKTEAKECNKNVFTVNAPAQIHTEGCSAILVLAIQKVNTIVMLTLLFGYPWFVAIFGMIVTWAFVCDVRAVPFKMCGVYICRKPKPAKAPPTTKFGVNTDVVSTAPDSSRNGSTSSQEA